MPRRGDHDLRRAEIVDAALRVMERAGLDGATTRAIADEAGCTMSVLAHYFGDKEGLLVAAQTTLYDRMLARALHYDEAPLTGLAALEAAVDAAMPLDAERIADACANAAFAAAALTHAPLADARRRARAEIGVIVARFLAEAREAGELRDDVDDGLAVEEYFVVAEGAALQVGLDPDSPEIRERVADLARASMARLRRD